MKFRKTLILFLFSLGILNPFYSPAANSTHLHSSWAMGFHIGGTSFFGDLADYSGGINNTPFSKYFYKDMRIMGGGTLEKWFGPYFGARGFLGYGNLQGTKETSSAWFEAHILEYNMQVMVDLTNLVFGVDKRRIFSVYSFVGMGFTESRTWKYSLIDGSLIGTNGFGIPHKEGGRYVPMTETVIPMGIGINVFAISNLSFYAEASFHPINTNKLDASTNINPTFITSLEGYNYFSIGFNFWFDVGGNIFRGSRGGAQYGSRNGISINPRVFRRNNRAIFKRGRSRFKFKKR